MTETGLDIDQIMALLPHRYPFLMLDRVLSVEPGVRAVGVKCISVNEPQFQGHFPGQAIMPGVLICEAFAQLAGIVALSAHADLAGKAVYLLGLDKMRFRKPVRPGDRLVITCVKESASHGIWRFRAVGKVDEIKVADGWVMATVADRPPEKTESKVGD
jgi:3-hydroxyacyl-[acyl-carrier-protein] dehydratase